VAAYRQMTLSTPTKRGPYMADHRDPDTRLPLDARVRCTLLNGEVTWGYLKSFKLADGTYNVWTHRDGATVAAKIDRQGSTDE
jgi:hypothetical protein